MPSILLKKFSKILVSLALVVAAVLPAFAQTSKDERLAVFDQVWSVINESYYDKDFNGTDWTKLRQIYRKKLSEKLSDEGFFAILDEMVSQLRDSHTRIYSPEQVNGRRSSKTSTAGFRIEIIGTRPVIADLDLRSDAAKKGLKNGMIVRSIDGVSFEAALKRAEKRIGISSSARTKRLRALSFLTSGKPGSEIVIEVQDHAGSAKKISINFSDIPERTPVEMKNLDSGIVYIKLNSFAPEVLEVFKTLINKSELSNGMILDLRSNSGGDGETGLAVAGMFFDEKKHVAEIVTRSGKPPVPGIPMKLETTSAGESAYRGPLAVLVDERTASTAELVANTLQEHRRARVFGTNSCGCVVAVVQPLKLRNGGELTISEFGFLTFKRKKLEGQGIVPDVQVERSVQDLVDDRDRVLELADEFLMKANN